MGTATNHLSSPNREAWARRPAAAEKSAGALPERLNGDLTEGERVAWASAVAFYDEELADLNPVFEMAAIRTALTRARASVPPGLSAEHQKALSAAAPAYRSIGGQRTTGRIVHGVPIQ